MRDIRTPLINPTTYSADGTYYGEEIDLLEDYTGSQIYPVSVFGFPAEILAKNVVTGTGDGFTVTLSWMLAPDSSGVSGTYVQGPTIGVFDIDTDGVFQKDGADYSLTRAKLQSRLRGVGAVNQWIKLKIVVLGITNGESIDLEAYPVDHSVPYADTGVIS